MSVLLAGLDDELTRTLAERLRAQDDEVRMVLDDPAGREGWRTLGIHVAVGDLTDEDFVWRAATNVRTVVVGDRPPADAGDVRRHLASMLTRTDADRLVVVGPGNDDELIDGARAAGLAHVVLRFRRRGLLGSRDVVGPRDLAAAIDAADDLAGEPRLDLDLVEPSAWEALRLEPPDRVK